MRLSVFCSLLVSLFFAAAVSAEDAPAQPATVKPVPRDAGWMKRHEAINERVKQGNIQLVFIGDSITDAWSGPGKPQWQERYAKWNAANLGIGGDRTQHVLWRLDNGNFAGVTPKAAVIMIGTNNSGDNKPEEIAAGIEAIVKKVHEKSPSTKVLLLAIFPRGADSSDKRRQTNEATNALIKKLDDGERVHYLDIGPKFLSDEGTLSKEIMPDLLHLSPRGYAIWAEGIQGKLDELMK